MSLYLFPADLRTNLFPPIGYFLAVQLRLEKGEVPLRVLNFLVLKLLTLQSMNLLLCSSLFLYHRMIVSSGK